MKPKVEHVRLSALRPCPENNDVYGKFSSKDPDLLALYDSVAERGVMEPLILLYSYGTAETLGLRWNPAEPT